MVFPPQGWIDKFERSAIWQMPFIITGLAGSQ
jgi:hypothetical protein